MISVALTQVASPHVQRWYEWYVNELPSRTAEQLHRDLRALAFIAAAGLSVPSFVMCAMFLYQAVRIRRNDRYPYPGMWILRDTPIERGAPARRRSRRFLAMAACFASFGVVSAGWLFWTIMGMLDPAQRP